MSEKKKSASQSEMEEPEAQTGEKEPKRTKASARETGDVKAQVGEKERKRTLAVSHKTEESKTRTDEKEQKGAKASAREERQSKPVRRETRSAPTSDKKSGGFRNWPVVRFTRDSYHELRYKVTWPTFPEARNMTLVVIALSTVVGLVLGLVDAGLFQLFRLITGK